MKFKLFTLIMLLTIVACCAKAQDLIAEQVINTEEIDPELTYCPYYFAYSNEKNILAIANDHDVEIVDASNKSILFKGYDFKNFSFFNKGQKFLAKYGKIIKIFDTSNWTRYDSLSYNDLTILDFALSNNQNKLCVLFKNGANLYPDMKLVIWDMSTKDILLEQTINCEFDFTISNTDDEFGFLDMDWNENLNYLAFEWSYYKDFNKKPYRTGRYFTKIYSINQTKMIKEYNHALSFKFDEDNNNAYFYEESYDSESKYCITNNYVSIVNLETDVKSKINFDFDQGGMASIQDYLLFSKSPCADEIFIINKDDLETKTLKLSYLHLKYTLTEDKTKLVSGLTINPCKIAVYDIKNITGVTESSKQTILYPNPTNNFLNLDLKNNPDCTIQIIDETGKVVDSFSVINSDHLNYDTSRLPKGMYLMQINSRADSKSYKFIKE